MAAIVLAAWGLANTDTGRDWIAERVEDALSTPEARAQVRGLSGPMPQRVGLDRLVLRDRDGDWLTVEAAEVTWRPLALLRGRLEVATITAERIALDRLPPGEEADTEEIEIDPEAVERALPELPLSVSLDRLAVERIELGEAVMGQPAVLRVEAEAAAPVGRDLRSRLQVERLDGPGERLDLAATFAPEHSYLTLEGEATADPGGLLAEVLEPARAHPAHLRLAGEGPLDDWQGHLDAGIGPELTLDFDLGIVDAEVFTLSGRAGVDPLLPPDAVELVGGPVGLDLRLRRNGTTGATVEKLEILTTTLRAELTGSADIERDHLDAVLDVALRDPASLNAQAAPASLQGAELRVTAEGPLMAPRIALDGAIHDVAVPDLRLDRLDIAGTYTPDGTPLLGDLEIALDAHGLDGAAPALAILEDRGLSARLTGRLGLDEPRIEGAHVEVAAPGIAFALDGSAEMDGPTAEAAFSLSLDDLGRLEPVTEMALAGRGRIEGHLTYGGAGEMLRATVAGDLSDLVWPEPLAEALAGDRVTLAGDMTMTPDGAISVPSLDISAAAVQASARLDLPADASRLDARLDVSLPELARLAPALDTPLAGSAALQARIDGPLDDPNLDAELDISDAMAADNDLGRVQVRTQLANLVSGLSGPVSLSLEDSPVGPADARAEIALDAERFELSALEAEVPGLSVAQGRVAVPLDGRPMEGAVELTIADASQPAGRFGLDLAGSGSVRVALSEAAEAQRVTVEAELRELLHGDSGTAIARTDLALTLDDALSPEPRVQGRLDVADLSSGDLRLDSVGLSAEGGLSGLALSLDTEGDVFGPLALASTAELALDGEEARLTLTALDATVQGRQLALDRPAVLRSGPDLLALEDLVLAAEGGTVSLDLRRAAGEIEAAARIDALPLALTRLVLAEPELSGRLDAEMRLSGPLEAPEGTLSLALAEVEMAETELPALDLSFDAALAGGRVEGSGEIAGLSPQPVRVSGSLPMALSLEPFAAEVDPDAPIEAAMDWRGQVAYLMPFIPGAGEHDLRGRGEVALRLSGSLNAPQPEGHVSLTDGRYENLMAGTLLTDFQMRLEGDGRVLEMVQLEAADGGSGRIEGGGTIDLAATDPRVDLEIDVRRAVLLRRDDVTARVGADIAIAGPLDDILVDGLITVERGEARMPDRMPPEIADLEVVERGRDAAPEEPEVDGVADDGLAEPLEDAVDPEAAPGQVRLDIAVDIPGRFFVRGGGLDSEWAGNLLIVGTADSPRIYGQIQAVRGQVDALGRMFRLAEGSISFDGRRDIDPEINVRAVNVGPEIETNVVISGNASDPQIELTSVPELPRDEILSRLLFGRGVGELSALEAAQLGAAVAQLAIGGVGGEGVVGRLRSAVGLDVLRLGETGVAAGVYLRDDLFIGVEQGLEEDTGQVRVELGLTDNISVESDVGATGRSQVGIQFKWDY